MEVVHSSQVPTHCCHVTDWVHATVKARARKRSALKQRTNVGGSKFFVHEISSCVTPTHSNSNRGFSRGTNLSKLIDQVLWIPSGVRIKVGRNWLATPGSHGESAGVSSRSYLTRHPLHHLPRASKTWRSLSQKAVWISWIFDKKNTETWDLGRDSENAHVWRWWEWRSNEDSMKYDETLIRG